MYDDKAVTQTLYRESLALDRGNKHPVKYLGPVNY